MYRNDTEAGTIKMITAMVLSGTIGLFVIESGQSFWNVVFFRCLIAGLFLAGYVKWQYGSFTAGLNRKVLGLIFAGGITLVGNWVLLFASFDYIPFSIATIAYHMQPIMLVVAGSLMARQLPSVNLIVWLSVAVLGLVLVTDLDLTQLSTLLQGEDVGSQQILFGLLLALGAALLYTVTTLLTKEVSQVSPSVIALVQVSVGVVLLLPMVDWSALPKVPVQWGALLTLGLVNTGFMYVIMYDAFQKLTTHLIAILSFVYPVTALVVDYFAFDNVMNLSQGLGVIGILLAVCAVKFDWRIGALMPTVKSQQKI
ncbi:DMT family transporter [Vibrio coralliilyticus]|uniref:DMT family transporter n=1 Tax=Vibrio coralliilyticus TaxID=190893 RepID=UPI0015604568|nr:DMT family transporter [Vibrio coralliilyticus]NRF25365.1 DMT family transporter [Vibrio coralliilyticus]NRF79573.1 DMT family transporter [Vibrio coralliilyticus]